MLMACCEDVAPKYLIRALSGKLRIGVQDEIVLAAIAQAIVMTPIVPSSSTTTPFVCKIVMNSRDKMKIILFQLVVWMKGCKDCISDGIIFFLTFFELIK